MSVQDLIARARAELAEAEPTVAPVEVGGELVDVGFRPLPGHAWAELKAKNPPRPGATLDNNVGYNSDALTRAYPLDKITVNGEAVDAKTWSELLSVLTSPGLKLISTALWGINEYTPAKRTQELGKARAGARKKKSRSRGN